MGNDRSEANEKETVLVIDNDPAVGQVVQKTLVNSGYEVLMADDARTALVVAEDHRGQLDLVITDLIMPGMNGRQLAERICALDPSVRILFMSGYTEDLLEEEDADVEGAAFIGKPFTTKELICKVQLVIHPEHIA